MANGHRTYGVVFFVWLLALGTAWAVADEAQPDASPVVQVSDESTAPPDASAVNDDASPAADDPATPDSYPVTSIEIVYPADVEGLPTAATVQQSTVALAATETGYASAPEGEGERVEVQLSRIDTLPTSQFRPTGIRAISQTIVRAINQHGLGGVRVGLDPAQIDEQGNDVRPEDDTSLRFVVSFVPVATVQTEAYGDRVSDDEATDDPVHQRILHNSPVGNGSGEAILRTDLVEDYIQFLNRHPGRRVDVAVAAGDAEDTFALRYLVQENKPWLIYAQVSNTGTEQTNEWRETFGFSHYQLTGRDDILSLTYSTAGFDASHAISLSYDMPIPNQPRWRLKLFGSYSEFQASEVGFTGAGFEGDTQTVGGELVWNFYQLRDWFVDFYMGLTYETVFVDNELAATKEREPFLLPKVGLRTQKIAETHSLFGSAGLTWNADGLIGTDAGDAVRLGRAGADSTWVIFDYSATASVYLEPLINRAAWDDLSTPESSTLAHEVLVNFRGQYILDDRRTIPQHQQTAGGLYTVRGYDESTAVGDNVTLVSAEYRFHLPRLFAIEQEPRQIFGQPFRVAPGSVRGRPDWDLILKAFVDYGQTSNNAFRTGDDNHDLIGTGVGAEVQIKRNLTVRVDWGIALKDADEVRAGDNRFHIVATMVY